MLGYCSINHAIANLADLNTLRRSRLYLSLMSPTLSGFNDGLAIVILNHNGRRHLGPCLAAVLSLDGLPGAEAVVVADNGSADGSLEFVRRAFPGVRVLAFASNLGFAAGNNRAAEAVDADRILFLNDDTRIAPDALAYLSATLALGATCAGARLVSWDGRRLDFDGGGAALTGHGHALGHGRPVPRGTEATGPRETLFGSGAALLIDRATFLAVGGFEPDYFAYYEDVDLGWRLWLAGHTVVHVPAAVVHHRHHGTAAHLPGGAAARLYERNALATVAKNYADDHLARVLPAALALAACRAGAGIEVIDALERIQAEGAALPLPPAGWPGWPYLAHLGLDFDALAQARARVQGLRCRPDSAVLPRLTHPYTPVPPTAAGEAALRSAVRHFDLEPVFGPFPSPGLPGWRAWGRRTARSVAALRAGGPGGLLEEARSYVAWRRQRGRAR